MNRPLINYPFGAGGRWLGHLLGSLEKNCKQLPLLSDKNFHRGYHTTYYSIGHFENGEAVNYTFSGLCKFNIFLNSWIKFRSAENYQDFNNVGPGQQIFILSNEARWRLGDNYTRIYEQKIDLDYSTMFSDTVKFREQLLNILQPHWPQEYMLCLTQEYIDFSAAAFRDTVIDPMQHLGNIESIGWLAWCHAQCLLKNIPIPAHILTQPDEYKDWVSKEQSWIIENTQAYTL